MSKLFDAIREIAKVDKRDNAPPPPALPTNEIQNWYDTNRNS